MSNRNGLRSVLGLAGATAAFLAATTWMSGQQVAAQTGAPSPEATASPTATAAATQDLVAALQANGFTQAAQAVQTSGLATQLQGSGPYTVFAPSDAAFAAIPQSVRDGLRTNPQLLRLVLLYHVVNGRIAVADLRNQTTLTSLEGDPITVSTNNGQVLVNGNPITRPDIQATNGVIHGIDKILVVANSPSAGILGGGASPTPVATATPQASAMPGM